MKFRIALYPSEEGFAVCATTLPGCWSQGATKEEATANIAEAIREYLEAEIEPTEAPRFDKSRSQSNNVEVMRGRHVHHPRKRRRSASRLDAARLSAFWAGGALGYMAGARSALRADAPAVPRSFGRAKSCILVYLFGGPSHIDIWDMKPAAPAEIRGEFKPTATNVPGIQITEHLPRLARLADQYAVVRSLSHGDNAHGSAGHTMLTGRAPASSAKSGRMLTIIPIMGPF